MSESATTYRSVLDGPAWVMCVALASTALPSTPPPAHVCPPRLVEGPTVLVAPRLPATTKRPDEVRAEFERLAVGWEAERDPYSSSLTAMVTCPSYQRIIGLGPAAVPMILEAFAKEPDHWSWALSAITGENPVPDAELGDIEASMRRWTDWGRQRGLIV